MSLKLPYKPIFPCCFYFIFFFFGERNSFISKPKWITTKLNRCRPPISHNSDSHTVYSFPTNRRHYNRLTIKSISNYSMTTLTFKWTMSAWLDGTPAIKVRAAFQLGRPWALTWRWYEISLPNLSTWSWPCSNLILFLSLHSNATSVAKTQLTRGRFSDVPLTWVLTHCSSFFQSPILLE